MDQQRKHQQETNRSRLRTALRNLYARRLGTVVLAVCGVTIGAHTDLNQSQPDATTVYATMAFVGVSVLSMLSTALLVPRWARFVWCNLGVLLAGVVYGFHLYAIGGLTLGAYLYIQFNWM